MTRSTLLSLWLVTVVLAMASASVWTFTGSAFAAGGGGHDETTKVNPMEEFALERIGPKLQVGPIDMSINKAVIYLWLAALICCLWTIFIARNMRIKPDTKQTFTEIVYEFAHNTIARATLGEKVFARYMPYVASLFMFLWVVNLLSFFPLPINTHTTQVGGFEFPTLGLYAATSNLNVTLALTLVTFVVSHVEGVRNNGVAKYFGSWAPPGSLMLKIFIWPLHALSEALRLVSLSARLFANMLAGHLLILMMLALIIILGIELGSTGIGVMVGATVLVGALGALKLRQGKKGLGMLFSTLAGLWAIVLVLGLAFGGVPTVGFGSPLVALFFFLFEFGLVASLQAFIFAMLSGIYIGFAAEPAH